MGYIEGYVPSQADVAVFDALKGKAPAKDAYPHAARWYAHISSFEAGGRKQFPKSQKDAASYVSGGAAPAADDDDDDVDLFGSDDEDEESEEAARIRQERLDAYAAKKSKKPALIAKLRFSLIANLGMTKQTWMRCSSLSRPLKWTDSFGVLVNLSRLDTESTNFR